MLSSISWQRQESLTNQIGRVPEYYLIHLNFPHLKTYNLNISKRFHNEHGFHLFFLFLLLKTI